jgi:hypothetical protein
LRALVFLTLLAKKPPGPAVVVMKSYPAEAAHSTLDRSPDAELTATVAEMQWTWMALAAGDSCGAISCSRSMHYAPDVPERSDPESLLAA